MKRQRGNIQLYLIIGVLLVAFAGGMVWTYKSAIVRAERAEADNSTLRTVNQEVLADNLGLRVTQARTNELLAQRQTQRNTADELDRRIRATLDEVFRNNKDARDWRDAAVPADVLRGLRLESPGAVSKDGKGSATLKLDNPKRNP